VPKLYPLTFHPIFKERIWGGRELKRLYGKALPPGVPIGESWELSDRPGDVNVIANGSFAGKDLRWLMEHAREGLLGTAAASHDRFPLLVKILDAREKLSLQVHPPSEVAQALGGEPKTELWFVVHAEPGAELFVGLKQWVTREEFARRIGDGSVQDCVHRVAVQRGDAMFLPSGRVHAIGAGNVIFEIQQNSDTTYRVHDWNRLDASGQPRDLHIRESLLSINFKDFEPQPLRRIELASPMGVRMLVEDPLFQVSEHSRLPGVTTETKDDRPVVISVVSGRIGIASEAGRVELHPGACCLLPAQTRQFRLECATPVQLLWAVPG